MLLNDASTIILIFLCLLNCSLSVVQFLGLAWHLKQFLENVQSSAMIFMATYNMNLFFASITAVLCVANTSSNCKIGLLHFGIFILFD